VKMIKSSPEAERMFEAAFPDDPRAERRQMFGYKAGFVNGNHFGGLFEDNLVLKLSEADRTELTTRYGAEPFMVMGRPMTGYLALPAPVVADPASTREWVQRAFAYVSTLPPKEKKPAKPRRARAS
jgi:TfoX/Sxy family transcriptional regulator of competence genes